MNSDEANPVMTPIQPTNGNGNNGYSAPKPRAEWLARRKQENTCLLYTSIGIRHGTETGPLQELPLTEESELRRTLHPYPPENLQILRKTFAWVTDDYDKIPAERVVMNDRELPGTVLLSLIHILHTGSTPPLCWFCFISTWRIRSMAFGFGHFF